MMFFMLEGWEIWLDKDGYFVVFDDWLELVVEVLVVCEELVLIVEYWEIF